MKIQLDHSAILERVRQSISRHDMITSGDIVVVWVSGGVDSMNLLHILLGLQKELRIQLIVAHLHHGLRGEEADREFIFVEKQAKNSGLPFEGQKVPENHHRLSTFPGVHMRHSRYTVVHPDHAYKTL